MFTSLIVKYCMLSWLYTVRIVYFCVSATYVEHVIVSVLSGWDDFILVGFLILDMMEFLIFYFFFFQAEDGIRDVAVTGVQTCALPI